MGGRVGPVAGSPGEARALGEGFPPGGLATPVPNLFFSQVLPRVSGPEELAVTLYLFYLHGQARGWPRVFTRRRLLAEAPLMRCLSRLSGLPPEEALGVGLTAALVRGSILRAAVEEAGRETEAYLINIPANRRAASRLGPLRLEAPPAAEASQRPNIFTLYEENIGGITPLIAEELREAEERYPAAWIEAAFREAVSLNKRSWRYIHSILRRWEAEGPDHETAERDPETEWLERRYLTGKRRPRRAGA